jgi:hypothetical protein
VSESNPLVDRVDALLKRHQQQQAASPALPVDAAGTAELAQPEAAQVEDKVPTEPVPSEDDIPVLTEIVDHSSLAEGIEAAVLERVLEELDQSLQMRLNRTIAEVVDQTLDGMRVDLAERVRHLVREAVATALAKQGIGQKRSP